MLNKTGFIIRQIFRLIFLWVIDAIALLLMAGANYNVGFNEISGIPKIVPALIIALIIGLANFIVRPLILLIAKKLGLLYLILATLFINAFIFWFVSNRLGLIEIDNFWAAFVASIIFTVINTVLTNILTISDKNSFYQRRIERLAKKSMYKNIKPNQKGLIVLEIDGLSFPQINKAIDKGFLPSLNKLIDNQNYLLDRYDCGLPSQTSACQAGIMFGDNYDIPAFRWYDKTKNKLYVSSKDSAEINNRYAKGKGLLRGGSSIDNMMSGDATKSLLTLSDTGDQNFKQVHSDDLYLLMIDPNFFLKSLSLFFGEVILEIYQGFKQTILNTKPRLNRLKHFYPLVRAATTVLTKDISTSLTILEIVRGTPALYVTFVGYDEVAHHSGPNSKDAFGVLKRLDHSIERIYDATKNKAGRQYNFVIISDHGQSYGSTFKQRYGYDLKEYINNFTLNKYNISQSVGGDDGGVAISSLANELDSKQMNASSKNYSKKAVNRTFKTLDNMAQKRDEHNDKNAGQITVCGSGNIAHIYFDIKKTKLTQANIENAYPGLINSLINHKGVGFIVTYDETKQPVVIGKSGTKHLKTNKIIGKDPLSSYEDKILRYQQIKKIAEFPHAGDLIINSMVFKDGTVAAFEELIGSHGGLGGEQTDAFILHPPNIKINKTTNSTDMYKILNDSRI